LLSQRHLGWTALGISAVGSIITGIGLGINLSDMRAAAIASTTSAKWQEARTTPRKDPLAIDLNGNGIQTVGILATGTPILFDHNADGIKTGTGWLAPDDAWLVLDRDGNGTIDSGRELFGADTMITATETIARPGGSFSYEVTRNARSGFEAFASLAPARMVCRCAGRRVYP